MVRVIEEHRRKRCRSCGRLLEYSVEDIIYDEIDEKYFIKCPHPGCRVRVFVEYPSEEGLSKYDVP